MDMKLRFASVVVVVVLTSAMALAQVEGGFERTLNVSGPVDLQVATGSGSINVRSGAGNTVQVTARIKARDGGQYSAEEKVRMIEKNPPIEQSGNAITIGRTDDDDRDLYRNVSISYEIVTPAQTTLRAATGSGSQTISGLAGEVKATTGSGSIRLNEIGAAVHANTGSGSIEAAGVKGSLRAGTGSGGIRGTGIAGAISATTGSGSVNLEQTSAGDVRVQTGSGSVSVAGVKGALYVRAGSGGITVSGENTGDWDLHSGSGTIKVDLPETAAFDLDASTSSGSITIDHPVTVQGQISKRSLRGSVRGGGPKVMIDTGSGSIHVN
jgi:DUF4097 and DUF4098 domain-containing protein YvlB